MCPSVLALVILKIQFQKSYLRVVILVSNAWTRFLASSFHRCVLFCWAVRSRVRSALELRLLSSSSLTRASSSCSFKLYSCSNLDTWRDEVIYSFKLFLNGHINYVMVHYHLCVNPVLCYISSYPTTDNGFSAVNQKYNTLLFHFI